MKKGWKQKLAILLLALGMTAGISANGDSFVQYAKQPAYPEGLAGQGLTGDVTLAAKVGTDGTVKEAWVVETSGNDLMDMEAMTAITEWRFYPLLQNGTPQEFTYQAHFHFEEAAPGIGAASEEKTAEERAETPAEGNLEGKAEPAGEQTV